jgi:uncharacterized protein (DUF305 family)
MKRTCSLSDVTKRYLDEFYHILDEMVEGMTKVELTDSISYNFIIQMIPHHKAAIDMSRNILQYTTNLPLQDIASNIITEQTKSIENMLEIECNCRKCGNSRQDVSRYQYKVSQIMQVMFHDMENACVNNEVNENFMREMIPHHRGAVEMSENALRYDICPELRPVLEAIITSQRKGIIQMEELLKYISA